MAYERFISVRWSLSSLKEVKTYKVPFAKSDVTPTKRMIGREEDIPNMMIEYEIKLRS